jgi:hypothetical protein
MPWRGQRWRTKGESIDDLPRERQAPQAIGRHADRLDHAQGLPIRADQKMLAVVECAVPVCDGAGASAEPFGALVDSDRNAALGERDCSGHAGIAATDDADIERKLTDVACA